MANKNARISFRLDSKDNPSAILLDSFSRSTFLAIVEATNLSHSATVKHVIQSQTGCATMADLRQFAADNNASVQRVFEIMVERYNK